MPLAPGDKLGPYEILAPIGKGGMGEVYKAHDPRLRRDVAIKVSLDQYTERFTREARAIAQLNHTNVCHLYDVGPNYLVMEYVEGADLKGPLDFEDALPILDQLIDGIEAAHEKNIIHRDLKPANIKITPEGVVKILDFGLAKAMESGVTQEIDPENSPTLTMGATVAGTILGTAAYMSPEQAKGKKADRRSDVWSFGVIVYELLTGKRLFQGETTVEILSGVLNRDIDLSAAPARVQRLLRWCLERDRKRRLASISDARGLLEAVEAAPTSVAHAQSRLPWMVAAGLGVALIGSLAVWPPGRTPPVEERPLVQLDVDLGADVSLPPPALGFGDVTISRDGTRLAYASGNPTRLYTRRLDQPRPTELPGTEGAIKPRFSPDGNWIAFVADSQLKKISVEGGAAVALGAGTNLAGLLWEDDGSILIGQALTAGLSRIPANQGARQEVAKLGEGTIGLGQPQTLPGGKTILLTAYQPAGNSIQVLTLADGKRKTVTPGTSGRFVPQSDGSSLGHLIYLNQSTLFAVAFDAEKLETRGTAVPMVENIATAAGPGTGQFDVSQTGTLLYRREASAGSGVTLPAWIDSAGRQVPVGTAKAVFSNLSLSPDGKRLALARRESSASDIWVYDLDRDALSRLTFDGININPSWSIDGQTVFYGQMGKGLYQVRADGASQPLPLIDNTGITSSAAVAFDGKHLAYRNMGTGGGIFTAPLETQGSQWKVGTPEKFLDLAANQQEPAFSPDGRWLAYLSTESGRSEIFVRPFPVGGGGKWQISTTGGSHPRWTRDGRELVFQSGDQLLKVSYTAQADRFAPGKPRTWIERIGTNLWELAPDGNRVIALLPVGEEQKPAGPDHEIVMLFNFFDELRRKVPLN